MNGTEWVTKYRIVWRSRESGSTVYFPPMFDSIWEAERMASELDEGWPHISHSVQAVPVKKVAEHET